MYTKHFRCASREVDSSRALAARCATHQIGNMRRRVHLTIKVDIDSETYVTYQSALSKLTCFSLVALDQCFTSYTSQERGS